MIKLVKIPGVKINTHVKWGRRMEQENIPTRILICDDDSLMRKTLSILLNPYGEVTATANTDEAKKVIQNKKFDLLILDIQMRTDREGIDAIPEIKKLDPELPIVILSGLKDLKTVRDAMKLGATDYLSKDFEPEEFEIAIERVLESSRLKLKDFQHRFETQSRLDHVRLIGSSKVIQDSLRLIEKFKKSDANILITGETGTGKELVAQLLRKNNEKGFEPFVAIDSATLNSGIAESILFGHEKGAFTGAEVSKKGLFEEANGGVIFFDEIANMPIAIQSKLLRILQEKEVLRIGSSRPIPLRFRVIAATNRDLEKMSEEGGFLHDLLQRLNVLPIHLPPLRDRQDDIPELVHYLLVQKTAAQGSTPTISDEALTFLKHYQWPGNVRELSAMIDYSLALSDGGIIDVQDLHPKVRTAQTQKSGSSFYEQIENFEKGVLTLAYKNLEGNISRIAKELDMDRSHLYAKLKLYRIHETKTKDTNSRT